MAMLEGKDQIEATSSSAPTAGNAPAAHVVDLLDGHGGDCAISRVVQGDRLFSSENEKPLSKSID